METKSLLDLAHEEFKSGHFKEAEKYCLQLWCDENTEHQVLLLLSSIYCNQEILDKAEYFAKLAIEKCPLSAQGYNNLGNVYKLKKQFDEAIENYTESMKLQPQFIDGFINAANIYSENENWNAAIHVYVTCLYHNPNAYQVRCDLGNLLLKQNRLQEAKACFLKSLEMKPDLKLALNNLGYIFHLQKETWLAIHYFEKATKVDPNFVEAHINLAELFKENKLYDNALESFRNVFTLDPTRNDTLLNMGEVHLKKGNQFMALNIYKQALQLNPSSVDAYCMIAKILKDSGELAEAETYCTSGLQISPTHPNCLLLLGQLYIDKFEFAKAVSVLKTVNEIHPNDPVVHNVLGIAYKLQGFYSLAITNFEASIQLDASNSDAYFNMGNAFREMRDFDNALRCFSTLNNLGVCSALYYCCIAHIYKDMNQIDKAIENYKLSLQIQKSYPEAFCSLVHCFICICNWEVYDSMLSAAVNITNDLLNNDQITFINPHHSFLFPLDSDTTKRIASQHANICLEKNKSLLKVPYVFNFNENIRMRIGYVSSDFGNHPTSHLIQSIPGYHNREKYEIFCFSLSPDDGTEFRAKISRESEHFYDVSQIQNNEEIADLIYKNRIQILLNLNGYTRGARNEVFALRPAPIQVMYLGYPGTSGASFMDYIITDKITSPPELSDTFSEKLAYMPNSFFIGDHKQMFPHLNNKYVVIDESESINTTSDTNIILNTVGESSIVNELIQVFTDRSIKYVRFKSIKPIQDMITSYQSSISINGMKIMNGLFSNTEKVMSGEAIPNEIIVTSRQQYGLPNDCIIFANFNQLYKIDPKIFKVWMTIIKSVPNSVLWLLRFPNLGEQYILEAAKSHNIDTKRIIFTNLAHKEEHVRRGQLVDICLDTTKCNGHTTCMDILWTGTPVITSPGETMASRIAASQLHSLGCPELIAKDYDDYRDIAIKLGTDKKYLRNIREKIWKCRNMSTLFDCKKYVSDLENLFSNIWDSHSNINK